MFKQILVTVVIVLISVVIMFSIMISMSYGDDLLVTYEVAGVVDKTREHVTAVFIPYDDNGHMVGVVRNAHHRLFRVEGRWCGKGLIETTMPDGKRAEFTVR